MSAISRLAQFITPDKETPLRGHFVANMLLISLVFVWFVALYWDTATQMSQIWWGTETYAHGLVVLPIFAWLLWQKRAQLAAMHAQPAVWMAIPVALAGLGWMLGKMVNVNALAHFALLCMLVSSLIGVLGWRLANVLLFPIFFLFFSVPIGDFLLPTLMHYTAEFTVLALRASGVPVYQEGLYFVVPNGRWAVVEACSGIRYLIASLMVGSLYAYLNYRSPVRRLLFIGVAIIVPIVANWLRAYFIVMIGYLTDNRLAAGVDHLLYGWVFFGVVILLMFWIGARWREDDTEEPQAQAMSVAAHAGWLWALPVMVILATSIVFPQAIAYIDRPVEPFTVTIVAPPAQAGWTLEAADELGYRPSYSGHRGELTQLYRHENGAVVGLYVAYYAAQRKDAELVAWGNRLTGGGQGSSWQQYADGRDALDFATVRRGLLRRSGDTLAVWHWYWSDGRVNTSDIRAKLMLALDRLGGRADDAAFVAVFTPFDDQPDDARHVIQKFLDDHHATLEDGLQRLEGAR